MSLSLSLKNSEARRNSVADEIRIGALKTKAERKRIAAQRLRTAVGLEDPFPLGEGIVKLVSAFTPLEVEKSESGIGASRISDFNGKR
jgi:hypothetical protein